METANGNKNGASTASHHYAFDGFEIDTANRTLRRDGVAIPLTGKVFDVLKVFAENPGKLLEKHELIEKVWPSAFVEEGNLARNVSTLRRALGDTGKDHKYIATVQGRGYRFLADVVALRSQATRSSTDGRHHTIDHKGATGIEADETYQERPENRWPEQARARAYERPWLFSIAGLCLIGIVVFAFRWEKVKPRLEETLSFDKVRQVKLTQDGNVYGGMISPDGQYLAYTEISGKERALCVRQMSTGSVLELQPPRAGISYWAAAFAPDNSFLYYILKEGGADYGNIYRVPLLGGQPHKLIQYADGGLTISPDGRKVAFVRIDRTAGTSSIIAADYDGTHEQTISSTNLDSMFYSLDWAPDGRSFVYSFKRHEGERDYWYLAEISTEGGTEQQIGDTSEATILMAKWLPDKSGLIVDAIDESTRQPQLYTVSYPDGARRRITSGLNNFSGFSMTADGRSIVIPQINSTRQIWDVPSGGTGHATQISSGTEKHFDAVGWAGGDYVIFDEDENSSFDNYNIYRVHPDGTDRQQLTFGPGNNTNPTVSPDGRTIVFVSSRSGKSQLWRMGLDGGNVTQLTDIPNEVVRPSFAPDGKTIYFSVSVAGQSHIWKVSADGGTPSAVIESDVYRWAVSPKGNYLAYSGFDKQTRAVLTRIHSLRLGEVARVLHISPETWMEWSGDEKAVYFNTARDGALNIWSQPLDGSAPHPITTFNLEQVFRFAWSPDRKRLACIRQTVTFDAVMLRFD